MTGMETAWMMPSIMSGSDIRDTPPWARMSAGTRSSAITATAPASSAIFACSGVTTSMITPPLSISAMPRLTRAVPVTGFSDTENCSSRTVWAFHRSYAGQQAAVADRERITDRVVVHLPGQRHPAAGLDHPGSAVGPRYPAQLPGQVVLRQL